MNTPAVPRAPTAVGFGTSNEVRARRLSARWQDVSAAAIVAEAARMFPSRIACVSSFGAESAVMLSLLAEAAPHVPVIFIDTGLHFSQTLRYRDRLFDRFGLRELRVVGPDGRERDVEDARGDLWGRDPEACCDLRRVRPLRRALSAFDAWFTGRKRHHGALRGDLPLAEFADGKYKVNPLAYWALAGVHVYARSRGLPEHPLVARSYPSIGCAPCTAPAVAHDSVRSGRWSGTGKTECGIHGRG